VRKADNLPPSCAVVTKSGNLNFVEPSGPVRVCNGTALPLILPSHPRLGFPSILLSSFPRKITYTFVSHACYTRRTPYAVIKSPHLMIQSAHYESPLFAFLSSQLLVPCVLTSTMFSITSTQAIHFIVNVNKHN